ncbi:MAG TPA: urea transporter, partial [Synechococcales bacterium UBA8647]|nr:urea transporter [Synechococcales bacterium UBA8647]
MAEPFLAPGIAWMLVVVFSVLWIALGIWWGRQGKGDADDFMLAGRNIGLALSTATLMASWVTGNTTLLAPEFGYRNGLWGMFSYALAGLGLILFAPLALRIKDLMPSA